MIKRYPVNKRNSTVLGYPGRDFDWSKFCWDGSAVYKPREIYGYTSIKPEGYKAPLPWKDGRPDTCEYLHVPYAYEEDQTIYRVRPNASMWDGKVYRRHTVESCHVILDKGVWYWKLALMDKIGAPLGE